MSAPDPKRSFPESASGNSDLGLFGERERVIDLDPEVSDCALELAMAIARKRTHRTPCPSKQFG
jgi:hypothetical protein